MQGDAPDAISPDLALVDPELAASARVQLPDPGQWRPEWREPSTAPDRREVERELLRHLLEERRRLAETRAPAAPARERSPQRRVPVVLVPAAVALVVIGALTAFDGGLVDRSRPVLRDTPEPPVALAPPRLATPISGRVFAWAPVAAASAYELRLLRGGRLIYRTTTPKTRVKVPASWVFRGRPYRLVADRYAWQVRPRLRGNRWGRPLVRAKVDLA